MVANAGALWWKDMVDTPMRRYDLINDVNARATFACAKAVLPHMLRQKHGHIITMSPPLDLNMLKGRIGYCISKFGMTLVAHGLGVEVGGSGVACNALWSLFPSLFLVPFPPSLPFPPSVVDQSPLTPSLISLSMSYSQCLILIIVHLDV